MNMRQLTAFGDAAVMLEALLHATPYPVLFVNLDQQLVAWNEAAQALFHLDEAAPPYLIELPGGEYLAQWLKDDHGLAEWTPAEDRRFRPYIELIGGADAPHGWVIFLRDVSETHRLVRSQAEYIRLISHDLRTPLTSVVGFTSMLQQTLAPDNPQQRTFLGKIQSGLTVLTGLLENIQDAGRFDPETGFYEMSRQPCDPGEIVRRIVKSYPMPADKPDLHVHLTIGEDVPIFSADANMLERAVSNLFDNAVKYTPNGRDINVEVQRMGDEVIIAVCDSGLGISPEDQQRLFQRHSRIVRQETKKVKGTGLGLFIVRSVALHHGGRAWVESELGQGSCFYMSLPIVGRAARQD
ncbi:MAG: PAS domain-containing protein [Anaerolineae bacterium]|nr:PAS domain-containing protein [Anaerolineae bacterium]